MLAQERFKNHSIHSESQGSRHVFEHIKRDVVVQDIIHAPSCLTVGKTEYFVSA